VPTNASIILKINNMENISQFGKGAIRDKYDPRDYQIKKLDTFGASVIPDEFSFRDSFDQTPIKNQDGSLSCGGQAFSKYFEGLFFQQKIFINRCVFRDGVQKQEI
jgi:citrate lyase alpha subunit